MRDLLGEFLKPIIVMFINFIIFAVIGKHLLWGFLSTFLFVFIYMSMDDEKSKKHNYGSNLENYGHGHGHGHGHVEIYNSSLNKQFNNKSK